MPTCVICLEGAHTVECQPCGHAAACAPCLRLWAKRRCPLCRASIERAAGVFEAAQQPTQDSCRAVLLLQRLERAVLLLQHLERRADPASAGPPPEFRARVGLALLAAT